MQILELTRSCTDNLKAVFMAFLNVDEELRHRVITGVQDDIKMQPVDPYKTKRFFQELRDIVVTDWLKREQISTQEFLQNCRDLYMLS